jgi:hypothetical protein
MNILIFDKNQKASTRMCYPKLHEADIVLYQKENENFEVMKNKIDHEFAEKTLKEVTLYIRPKNSIEVVGDIKALTKHIIA